MKFLVLCALLAGTQAGLVPNLLETRTLGSSILTGQTIIENGALPLAGWGSPVIAARSSVLSAPLLQGTIGAAPLLAEASPVIAARTLSAPILTQQTIAAPVLRTKSLIDNAGLTINSETAPILAQSPIIAESPVIAARTIQAPILAQQTIAAPVLRAKSLIDNAGLTIKSETAPILAPAPILAQPTQVIAARTIETPILAQQAIAAPVLRTKSLIDNAGIAPAPLLAARTISAPLALNGLAWSNGYGLARSSLAWNGVAPAGLVGTW